MFPKKVYNMFCVYLNQIINKKLFTTNAAVVL